MKRSILQAAAVPAMITAGFVVLDVVLDHWMRDPVFGATGHLVLVVSGALIVFVSTYWAIASHSRLEVTMQRAYDDLESRVRRRTAELERANAQLQAEIVERERITHALRASEESERALMDASPEAALLIDTQGIVLAANQPAARRLGITVEQLVGSSLFAHFPPDVEGRGRAYLDPIMQSGQPLHFAEEQAGLTLDNYVYPVYDEGRNIIRFAVFSQDVTERRRAEEAIRASEAKFAAVFYSSPDAIGIFTVADRRLLDLNQAFCDMLGHARSEVVGRSWSELRELVSTDREAEVEELLLEHGQVTDLEVDLATGQGEGATILLSLTPTSVNGEPCLVTIAHDITDRRHSERALHQVQVELRIPPCPG